LFLEVTIHHTNGGDLVVSQGRDTNVKKPEAKLVLVGGPKQHLTPVRRKVMLPTGRGRDRD